MGKSALSTCAGAHLQICHAQVRVRHTVLLLEKRREAPLRIMLYVTVVLRGYAVK